MEYHYDRFEDFSLMVFKDGKLMALLPANKVGLEIHSHQGLSYGGLILHKSSKFRDVLQYFSAILILLNTQEISTLHIKLMPRIYQSLPSDELSYLLFILKAELKKKDVLSVIEMDKSVTISPNRMEGVKRGKKHQLIIKEETNFEVFWNEILSLNLEQKHGVSPVHSLIEIEKLKQLFPEHIRQFNVYHNDKLVAGTTIFESQNVAHCQYISGDKNKNALGSLDFLHHHLITKVFKDKRYFDFGSSNEDNGMKINEGLQYWKEGFGARTIIHEFYSIKTENANLLMDVLT